MKYVDVDKARSEEHRLQMEEIVTAGVCPFCPEHLPTYHPEPPLDITEHWVVTNNMHPYIHTAHHLLLIAQRHIEHVDELQPDEWVDLGRVVARHTMEIPAGALAARFGDISRTAASVAHLHFHIIEPATNIPEAEKVRFKISR